MAMAMVWADNSGGAPSPREGAPGVQQHAVEKGDDAHQVRHLEGQDELRRVVQLLLVEDVVSAKGKIKFKRVWWWGGGGVVGGHEVTMQYNFIAKHQYNCTRNVLWGQVHSSQANYKTSLHYNNSKQACR